MVLCRTLRIVKNLFGKVVKNLLRFLKKVSLAKKNDFVKPKKINVVNTIFHIFKLFDEPMKKVPRPT
jgi:hypothetical protein